MVRPLTRFALLLALLAPESSARQITGRPGPTLSQGPAARLARYVLSDHPVLFAEGTLGEVERNRAVGTAAPGDGGPLTIEGVVFQRGFGTRATSVIAVGLAGRAALFRASVGIDDQAGPNGSAVFRVIGDGVVLFDSGRRTGTDPALSTGLLDVRGVRELLLVALDDDDGFANDLVDWCEPTIFASAAPLASDVPFRGQRGTFTPAQPWPVDAIHAALLYDGRLLTHASRSATSAGDPNPGAPHDSTRVDVYDPRTLVHVTADHPTDEIIGAGSARASDGTLVQLGGFRGRVSGAPIGSASRNAFEVTGDDWLPTAPLSQPRYGPGALTLGSGALLAIGGAHQPGTDHRPELETDGGWNTLRGIDTQPWNAVGDPSLDRTFPAVHLAPDGRVLWAGWDERMALLDTRGSGSVEFVANREAVQRAFGTSTLVRGDRAVSVGGVDHRGNATRPALRSAVTIGLGSGAPTVTSAGQMLFRRVDHDATILADGRLLISGGSAMHQPGSSATAIQVAEIYDPETGAWSLAARSSAPRGHRSTALLLPDGRVWTGGGGAAPTAEFFAPPYLFDANGQPAVRPNLAAAPRRVAFGETFGVLCTGALPIERVTFVRLGSSSHGVNSDQRLLELDFIDAGGGMLQIDAPARGNDAPPGTYMLFCIDQAGTPSVAQIVQIGVPRPTAWEFLAGASGPSVVARHETAAAEVNGKVYLIGGRGLRPTQEYDPAARAWRTLGPPPFELHHFQPVVLDGKVYVVGAFTGGYPNEQNVQNIWIFDPASETWSMGVALPAGRARGSAGTVGYDGRFYLVGGNNQGHNGGARPWFDVYDPASSTWTQLPDAPRARDHFLAAVVSDRLVLAGGRRTTQPNPFVGTVREVDVYDFATGTWSTLGQNIPTERAGTMTVASGRHVVVIGGESASMLASHREVEALDVIAERWVTLPELATGRHSGGIATVDGIVHAISGSGNRGGTPELVSTELLDIRGTLALPAHSTNAVANAGFDAGLTDWTTSGNVVLALEHGVAAPGARVAGGVLTTAVAATPGTTYRVRLLHRSPNAAGTAVLRVSFENAAGSTLQTATTPLASTSPLLVRASADATAPAGAARLRVTVETTGARISIVDDVTVLAL